MKRFLIAVSPLLLASPAAAETPAPPPAGYGAPIAVKDALDLIAKGMQQAEAKGFKMAFAVVEPSGEIVAFARMDDVVYASVAIAQQKARTAARFRMPTAEFEARIQGGRTVLLSSDEVMAVGGGVPIVANGRVIGALGISRATAAEDTALANAIIEGR